MTDRSPAIVRAALVGLVTLALTALTLTTAARAADLTGTAGVEAGSLDHPLGVAVEPSTPYVNGRLDLSLAARSASSLWKLTYNGGLHRFDPETALDFSRHAVGLEWARPRERDAVTVSLGVQAAVRRNADAYRVYDHDELYGYLAFKTYPRPSLMTRAYVGLRVRSYADLPEESYLEPHAVVELKRFWENRTTVGASLRLGGKWFHDPVAPRVWGTEGTPHAAQLSATLDLARGLSERVGLSASLQQRLDLAGFPYYVDADVYDSPLLDRYARGGPAARAAVKVLTPLQAWLELGGAWREDDYGEILFPDGADGAHRRDTVRDLFASLERPFLKHGQGTVLALTVAWRDQASSLPGYTWSGLAATAGVQWRW